jgi:hypothetical protein
MRHWAIAIVEQCAMEAAEQRGSKAVSQLSSEDQDIQELRTSMHVKSGVWAHFLMCCVSVSYFSSTQNFIHFLFSKSLRNKISFENPTTYMVCVSILNCFKNTCLAVYLNEEMIFKTI